MRLEDGSSYRGYIDAEDDDAQYTLSGRGTLYTYVVASGVVYLKADHQMGWRRSLRLWWRRRANRIRRRVRISKDPGDYRGGWRLPRCRRVSKNPDDYR